MDFDYQRGANRFIRNSSIEIQDDLRELTQAMNTLPGFIGVYWVMEWKSEDAVHAHAIFYLNGQEYQKSFPFILQAGELWHHITHGQGKYQRCRATKYHQDNINNVAEYHNNEVINSLRRIARHLTKEEQKYGYPIWRYNEVPPPARQ